MDIFFHEKSNAKSAGTLTINNAIFVGDFFHTCNSYGYDGSCTQEPDHRDGVL